MSSSWLTCTLHASGSAFPFYLGGVRLHRASSLNRNAPPPTRRKRHDDEEEDPVELPYDNETPLIREDVDSLTVPAAQTAVQACGETPKYRDLPELVNRLCDPWGPMWPWRVRDDDGSDDDDDDEYYEVDDDDQFIYDDNESVRLSRKPLRKPNK
jgi:hypothetical protein